MIFVQADPYWVDEYIKLTRQQLTSMAQWVKKHKHSPDALRDRYATVIALLEKAFAYPALQLQATELICLLHPWPLKWGLWSSWEQQIRAACQVLDRQGKPARKAELFVGLASLLHDTGRLDECVDSAQQAIDLSQQRRAVKTFCDAGGLAVTALIALGRLADATVVQDQLENGLLRMQKTRPADEIALGNVLLGLSRTILLRRQGQRKQAAALGKTVILDLEQFSHILSTGDLAVAQRKLAMVVWANREYELALELLHKAHGLFVNDGNEFRAQEALADQGLVYCYLRQLPQAEKHKVESVRYFEKTHAFWHLSNELGDLAVVYFFMGKLREAETYFTRQVQIAQKLGNLRFEMAGINNRGAVLTYQGNFQAAWHDLQRAVELSQGQEIAAEFWVDLAIWHALQDYREEARRCLETAAPLLLRREDAGFARIRVLRCQAMLALPQDATALLAQALDLSLKHQDTFQQAGCYLELARLAQQPDQRQDAWRQGCELLERMGADTWVKGHSADSPPFIPIVF